MTRRYILLLVIAVAGVLGGRAAVGTDDVIERISTRARDVKTLSCDFVQTRVSSMLGEAAVSSGHLDYAAPDCLRWQCTAPADAEYTLIVNGDTMAGGTGGAIEVIDLRRGNRSVSEIMHVMMETVTGRALADRSTFTTTVSAGSDDTRVITLTPVRRDMRAIFSRIELTYSTRDDVVTGITLYEKSGDYTSLRFSNISINGTIAAGRFTIPR